MSSFRRETSERIFAAVDALLEAVPRASLGRQLVDEHVRGPLEALLAAEQEAGAIEAYALSLETPLQRFNAGTIDVKVELLVPRERDLSEWKTLKTSLDTVSGRRGQPRGQSDIGADSRAPPGVSIRGAGLGSAGTLRMEFTRRAGPPPEPPTGDPTSPFREMDHESVIPRPGLEVEVVASRDESAADVPAAPPPIPLSSGLTRWFGRWFRSR